MGSKVGNEIDLYAGRSGGSGSLRYSFAGYAYMDRGLHGIQYAEAQALLWRDVGPVVLQLEVSGVPKQRPDMRSNLYLAGMATIPLFDPRFSIRLHSGREKGNVGHKLDWEASLAYSGARINLTASLVGSTRLADRSPVIRYEGGTGFIMSASTNF